MKIKMLLAITIFLLSCRNNTYQNPKSKQSNEDWQIETKTVTRQTYNSSSLLDTSFETSYFYKKNTQTDSIKTIIVRYYDNNRLTNEKHFTLLEDGSKTLSSEMIRRFDAYGNLLIDIYKIEGIIESKAIHNYDLQSQLVKTILIEKIIDENLYDKNIDSLVAHLNDQKQAQYDTTINTYDYDESGNQIRVINADTKGQTRRITLNTYNKSEKIAVYQLMDKGDTISKSTYIHEGKLTKQITEWERLPRMEITWRENDKIAKRIEHNAKTKIKRKSVYIYNNRGDEIENDSFR